MSFLQNLKFPWKKEKNEDKIWEKWPEMVMISRQYFENLISKEVCCRFIEDMNQGTNGNLILPASWMIDARPVIQECIDKILNILDENATEVSPKIKILGLKFNKETEIVEEVKA